MNDRDSRVRSLEARLRPAPCGTCHGVPSLHVFVERPEDADLPAYTPAACPACGRAIDVVRQTVGIACEDLRRMFRAADGTAAPIVGCDDICPIPEHAP